MTDRAELAYEQLVDRLEAEMVELDSGDVALFLEVVSDLIRGSAGPRNILSTSTWVDELADTAHRRAQVDAPPG